MNNPKARKKIRNMQNKRSFVGMRCKRCDGLGYYARRDDRIICNRCAGTGKR